MTAVNSNPTACSLAPPDRLEPPDLRDRRVVVFGMGLSGLAAAGFLKELGAEVLLTDTRSANDLRDRLQRAQALGVSVHAGLPDNRALAAFDLGVISPGLAIGSQPFAQLRASGLHIVGEVELAFWFCRVPMIAVCGTNGKGTTAALLGDMLNRAGLDAVVAGNIGLPLVGELDEINRADLCVAEVSSFQLETIESFRPRVVILLNVTPDHLDYHPTFESYLAAKSRAFENQQPDDFAVLNADDDAVARAAARARSTRLHFSLGRHDQVGARLDWGRLALRLEAEADWETLCHVDDINLAGPHNVLNVMAAALAARLAGAPTEPIARAAREFALAPHIRQRVGEVNGVVFVDDSKATNPAATMAALSQMAENPILIAGGADKNVDFTELAEMVAQRVKGLVLIGTCAEQIRAAVRQAGGPEGILCPSLEEAVSTAYDLAEPGDVVLLSPACSSLDMFAGAARRGEAFAQAVRDLANRLDVERNVP
ncbi:MAG: UDP-N-acetylmuramoyl-L-alanine--D-glutamate ligase [Armatimonadota bacterium]